MMLLPVGQLRVTYKCVVVCIYLENWTHEFTWSSLSLADFRENSELGTCGAKFKVLSGKTRQLWK